jgi:lipid-A-disaccharide synthase-like uncharacterized protein
MGVPGKAFLCLLLTCVALAAFSALSWLKLFDFVEVAYYEPASSREFARKLDGEAALLEGLFAGLQVRFAAVLREEAMRNCFNLNQNEADVYARGRIAGELMAALPALRWVRIVDGGGARIHFSTESDDYVIRSGSTAAFRAWTEVPSFFKIAVDMMDDDDGGVLFDALRGGLVFYRPFYDGQGVKRGVALFSLSSAIIADALYDGGFIAISDPISLVQAPKGILIGVREEADGALRQAVAGVWSDGGLAGSVAGPAASSLALFSKRIAGDVLVGFLADESAFELSLFLKVIMLSTFGASVYVVLFFLMNLRQDPVGIVQNRMKNLQVSLYREYCERKAGMDWAEWKRELSMRREAVRGELRRGFSGGRRRVADRYVDALFDKGWDDFICVMSNRSKKDLERLDEEQLEDMLNRILQAACALVDAGGRGAPPSAGDASAACALEVGAGAEGPAAPEELEEIEELAALEELAGPEEFGERTEPAAPAGFGERVGLEASEEPAALEELAGPEEFGERAAPEEAAGFGERVGLEASEEPAAPKEFGERTEPAAPEGFAERAAPEEAAGREEQGPGNKTGESIAQDIVREVAARAAFEKEEQAKKEREEQEKIQKEQEEERHKLLAQEIKRKNEETAKENMAKQIALLEADPFDPPPAAFKADDGDDEFFATISRYGDFLKTPPDKSGGKAKGAPARRAANAERANGENVINERHGLPYIAHAKKGAENIKLDPTMKKLVNSVLASSPERAD